MTAYRDQKTSELSANANLGVVFDLLLLPGRT
jgi:hypothetical protein